MIKFHRGQPTSDNLHSLNFNYVSRYCDGTSVNCMHSRHIDFFDTARSRRSASASGKQSRDRNSFSVASAPLIGRKAAHEHNKALDKVPIHISIKRTGDRTSRNLRWELGLQCQLRCQRRKEGIADMGSSHCLGQRDHH